MRCGPISWSAASGAGWDGGCLATGLACSACGCCCCRWSSLGDWGCGVRRDWFSCPARDGLQHSGVAGRKSASGVGGTLGGVPGADANAVDGGIGGDLASVVGASVSAQRGELTMPLSLVFSAPVPAWEAFQRYTALRCRVPAQYCARWVSARNRCRRCRLWRPAAVSAVRGQGPAAAHGPMPGRLAPRHRTGHRTRQAQR